MALKLMVAGTVVQSPAYCMTDAEAQRAMASKPAPRQAAEVAHVPRRNVVAAYLSDGVLRPEAVRAALEIAEHWHAVTRALHARCGLYAERLPRGPEGDDPPSVVNRTARYRVWAEWANGRRVTPAASLVDVTLDLAVDGLTWWGIREKRGISNQRAKRLVQASLWQYALLSGWAEERTAKAA